MAGSLQSPEWLPENEGEPWPLRRRKGGKGGAGELEVLMGDPSPLQFVTN